MKNVTSGIITALEKVIARVAKEHGLSSRVSLVVGATGGGVKHGHFLAKGWQDRDGNDVHEIVMTGESLERGAVPTLGTMLHELAHLYNFENDIQDVSDGGRYHNQRFRKTAEAMGLSIEIAPRIGHSVTTVPVETQARYADVIADLDEAITAWKRVPVLAAAASNSKKFLFGCPECDDPVQVTKKWGEAHDGQYECAIHNEWLHFWIEGE